jgi:hypothetical protein
VTTLGWVGWVGVWLVMASVYAIVVEGVLVAMWGIPLVKRSRALSEQIETERGLIEADLKRLRAALEETERLWRPYRRALRLLRHPLAIALFGSLGRRRAMGR